VIYPASDTGAWEAALINTLESRRCGADVTRRDTSPRWWKKMAEALGLKPEFLGLPGLKAGGAVFRQI